MSAAARSRRRPRSLPGRLAWLALAILLGLATPARAQLFGSSGLDPAFCKQPTLRQSVVYVDDMLMVDGQTDWALRLLEKLRATLSPGERVTVVRLSPGSGQSSEAWSGCWPNWSDAERAKLAAGTYLFQRNPLDRIAEQQRFFARDFGAALTTIYAAAKRPAASVRFEPSGAPSKQILRALASDGGRFAASTQTVRAIVYSDFAENSDLGSVFHPAEAPVAYGARLGTFLRRSVFYGFGIASDVINGGALQERIRSFWLAALRSMNAAPEGIGADLNVSNVVPVRAAAYDVTLDLRGQGLDGRLSLLADADGTLVDSWIGISRLTVSSLDGSLRCTARPDAPDSAPCRLAATTLQGVATSSPESVSLSGPLAGPLAGQLGVKGTPYLFSLKAQRAAD